MDELLAELRSVGHTDSEGRFTLDLARALEKMRRFQLAEPGLFVLSLLGGLAHLGADHIQVEATPHNLCLEWTGTALTRDQMLALLDPITPSPVQELAQGLAASGATSVRIRSGSSNLLLDPTCLTLEPCDPRPDNRMQLAFKLSLRQRLWRKNPVLPHLERCRLGRCPITWQGHPLQQPLEPPGAQSLAYLEGPPATRLRATVPATARADFSALIALMPPGQVTRPFTALLHEISYPLEPVEYPGAQVVLGAEGLQKDLSGATLVLTTELRNMRRRIELELDRMALELSAAGNPEHLPWLVARLRRRLEDPRAWMDLLERYGSIAFLRGVDDRPLRFDEVAPGYVRYGYLPVTGTPGPGPTVMEEGEIILHRPHTGWEAALIDALFPEQCPVHFSSAGAHLTGERFLCPRLPPADYLVRRFLTGVSGELGFPPTCQGPARVLAQVRGEPPRPLENDFPLLPEGLVVVVRPSDGWDARSFERAVAARLPEAYAALDWVRRHQSPQAADHLRAAAELGRRLWLAKGRPTPTARDFLNLRMHEGGPEIRFVDPELLDDL